MMKLSGVYLFDEIVKRGWFGKVLMVNMIYDQHLVESPEEMTEEVCQVVQECMERAGWEICPSLGVPAVPEVLDKWKK